MIRFFKKIYYLYNQLLNYILLRLALLGQKRDYRKRILVVHLQGIGDYILFRNFLKSIKENFPGYELHYLGQQIVKDIAEYCDSSYVDKFLWMNKNKDRKKIGRKFKTFRRLRAQNYEIVINPRFRRDYNDIEDFLVRSTQAKHKIGAQGYKGAKALPKYNQHYTQVITCDSMMFEYNWNLFFIERLTRKKINIRKPYFEPFELNLTVPKENFVILFPGANADFRRWAPANFSQVGDYLIANFNYKVIISGSPSDNAIGKKIIKNSNYKGEYSNYCGKTNLLELVYLISKSDLLVSNETSAPHIAAATSTPFVCISNGNHFGRFNPYPEEVFHDCYTVYPDEIVSQFSNFEVLVNRFGFGSDLDINEIKVKEVIFYINHVMSEEGFGGMEKAI